MSYMLEIKRGYMVERACKAGESIYTEDISFFEALKLLAGGGVKATDDIPGYPITKDEHWYYKGAIETDKDIDEREGIDNA